MIHIKTEKELEKMRVAGRLTAIARKAAADAVKPGVTTWEIDRIVRKTIEDAGAKPSFLGYGGFPGSACVSLNDQVIHGIPSKHAVVKDYVGHGVGAALHESPEVPNYGKPGHGIRLQRGMVIAVEPMVNVGVYTVKVLPDGWTVKTRDGKLSAHYENTIAITDGEPEILTNIDGEVL